MSSTAPIMRYVARLSSEEISLLYQDLFTVITVFRSLNTISQQLVMRLVYINEPILRSTIEQWYINDNNQNNNNKNIDMKNNQQNNIHINVLNELIGLRIIHEYNNNTIISLSLNHEFQVSMQQSLSGEIPEAMTIAKTDINVPSLDYISSYADNTWQTILHYMVQSAGTKDMIDDDDDDSPLLTLNNNNNDNNNRIEISNSVKTFLIRMGLMAKRTRQELIDELGIDDDNNNNMNDDNDNNINNETKLVITSNGFSFLFKSLQDQIWDILTNYLSYVDDISMNRDDALRFIFRLSFLAIGQGYGVKKLTKTQQTMVIDLSKFGIIYLPESNSNKRSNRFYPTNLIYNLSSNSSSYIMTSSYNNILSSPIIRNENNNSNNNNGFIIIENSFKIYAFTRSQLHISLLRLFVSISRKLPDLITGVISKESAMHAFKRNITANDILNYLRQYSHPELINNNKNQDPIPATVHEQIKLWEEEKYRMTTDDGVMISEFKAVEQFYDVVNAAKEKAALLWCDNVNHTSIIVKSSLFDSLKTDLRLITKRYADRF